MSAVATARRASGMLPFSLVTMIAVCTVVTSATGDAPYPGADPFLWLESIDSPRARDWVKADNAKTLSVLQSDPRFTGVGIEKP